MSSDFEEDVYVPHEYDDEDRYIFEEGSGEGELDVDIGKTPRETPEYGINPSDWNRISHGGGASLALTSKQKVFQDPRTSSLDKIKAILNNPEYEKFSQTVKDKTFNFIEDLSEKKMVLYNVDILTAASLFTVYYKDTGGLNRKNVASFLKMTRNLEPINHLDFIRYARMLKGKK